MLPLAHRLTDGASFRETTRRGRRAPGGLLVLHLLEDAAGLEGARPARVGLIVSRAVGGAATRNLVQRRLRHLLRRHVASLPPGSALVVRALPSAATASSVELDRELRSGLSRLGVVLGTSVTLEGSPST